MKLYFAIAFNILLIWSVSCAKRKARVSDALNAPQGCDATEYIKHQKNQGQFASIVEKYPLIKERPAVAAGLPIGGDDVEALLVTSGNLYTFTSTYFLRKEGRTLTEHKSDAIDPCFGDTSYREISGIPNYGSKFTGALGEITRLESDVPKCEKEGQARSIGHLYVLFSDGTFSRYSPLHDQTCANSEEVALAAVDKNFESSLFDINYIAVE